MTDDQLELESDAPRRRATRVGVGVGVAAAVGLVVSALFAVGGDKPATQVASRGRPHTTATRPEVTLDVDKTIPSVVPTVVTLKRPRVTVPRVPKLPVLTTLPVICPPDPPAPTVPDTGVFRTDGTTFTRLLRWDADRPPQDVDLSPDGTQLVFDRANLGNQEVLHSAYLAKGDGTGVQEILTGRQGPHQLHWSPDGKLIAFRDWTARDRQTVGTYVVDPATWSVTQIGANSQGVGFYEWSPDSKHLAWGDNASAGLFIGHVDGIPMQHFAGPTVWDVDWSPDSTELVATTMAGGATRYSVDGLKMKPLDPAAKRVAWSRVDRKHLILDTGTLEIVDPDSGLARVIGDRGLYGTTRDGSRIVTTGSDGFHLLDYNGCRHTVVSGSGLSIALRDWDDANAFIVFRWS